MTTPISSESDSSARTSIHVHEGSKLKRSHFSVLWLLLPIVIFAGLLLLFVYLRA